MTFTFPRLSAKWIVVDVVDTPQHVSKTLKDAKDACINLIIFDVVDNTVESDYNDSVEVDKVNPELNKVLEGSLHCYKQVPGTDKFEEVSPSVFGFGGEPTLEPIEF
jgi:hypothetical protein